MSIWCQLLSTELDRSFLFVMSFNTKIANTCFFKFYDLFACDMSALDFMLLLIIFEV